MRFPEELWDGTQDREIARSLVDAFEDHPILLTDKLANTIYLTPAAEELFRDRAEALVNRLTFSLVGYGEKGCLPPGLKEALLGESGPWRGVISAGTGTPDPHSRVAEASAVLNGGRFVCGVLRISKDRVTQK